jgi:putative molybdopterin biosynthesis protein
MPRLHYLPFMGQRLDSSLRDLRLRRGWTQEQLAEQARISRQSYGAIESGASVPSTEVALRLARAFGSTVDQIFRLPSGPSEYVEAEMTQPYRDGPAAVVLVRVGGRLFARPVEREGGRARPRADGIAYPGPGGRARVEVLPDRAPREALVALGGDPALGIMAEELASRLGIELLWWPMGSHAALEALGRGEAHLAGIHLLDETTGLYNGPVVDRLLPFRTSRVGFAIREQVLLVQPGNPLGVGGMADLARPGVRFVNREPGSGSRVALDLRLRSAGIDPAMVPGYLDTRAGGHFAVAESIASGTANVGMTILAAASGYPLDTVPFGEEQYDLVIPDHFLDLPAMQALLSHLGHRGFRRQIEALGGYDLAIAGVPQC